jgi:Carboxypeptidase regulatory-like domain
MVASGCRCDHTDPRGCIASAFRLRLLNCQGSSFRCIFAALAVVALLVFWAAAPSLALAATGSISGTVTGAPTHAPVAGVEVCARQDSQLAEDGRCVLTGPNGAYEIDSLAEEDYELIFWPRHGTGLNFLRDGSNFVPVVAGETTVVDFELAEAGSIEGRVISELDGTPLAGVEVCAYYQWEDHEPSCALTDSAGRYLLVGLGWVGSPESEYRLQFFPERSGLHYFRSYGGLVGFDEELDDLVQAEPVPVSWAHVTKVPDQTLKPDAEVTGLVTAAADGRPLARILVCVAPNLEIAEEAFWWNTLGHERAKCTRTNSAGAYSVGKLQGGQYKVLFSLEIEEFVHYLPPLGPEEDGFPTLYWRDGSSWAQADVLTVTAPTVVTGIDAQLGPPPPATPASSGSPFPPATAPLTLARKPKCKRGWRIKRVNGRYHCVKRRKASGKSHRHSARHHHARPVRSSQTRRAWATQDRLLPLSVSS